MKSAMYYIYTLFSTYNIVPYYILKLNSKKKLLTKSL